MAAKKNPAPAAGAGSAIAELSPDDQALQALKFEATKTQLLAIAGKFTRIVVVPAGADDAFEEAKAARLELRSARTTVEKVAKDARDGANKFQKAVIAREKELVALVSPEEQRLAALVDGEQRRRDDEAAEAARVIRERAEKINQAFARIRSLASLGVILPVARLDQLIDEAKAFGANAGELPEDLQAAGRYESNVAVDALVALRAARVQADADAAELAELRAKKAAEEAAAPAPAPVAPSPAAAQAALYRTPVPAAREPLTASQAGLVGAGRAPAPRAHLTLLEAAQAAHRLLVSTGLGDRVEAQQLSEAIDAEVDGAVPL